ncbi:MAG TPA: 3-deoxy-7-phosphoheptulonate synthase [Planctomycetota bacterium]|nr:3-deoxy-7-phosphoheptulonate synthase [Planctomycetota bacterium]
MLIRLKKKLSPGEIQAILDLARELSLATRFLDAEREYLELSGTGRPEHRSRFEDLSSVHSVLDAGSSRELHERVPGRPDTQVAVGAARFGNGAVSLIAGPCAIESYERTLEIARAVRERGALALRGGAFKPRTSPYSFQGTRAKGLEILERVRVETGLAIVTEVLDPRDVESVGEAADMYQIGSRNMFNAPLLIEVGRTRKPVLLKRGFMATLREFVLAAEYILSGGNTQVVLCERGVRSFDTNTRNLLDVGGVAYLKRHTHLPVIVDPSHAAGRGDLVRPLARAGLAAGADGVIVEVHPNPSEVHSDGNQAISPQEFARLAQDARAIALLDGRQLIVGTPLEAQGSA